jgi:hypothetical protein
VVKQSRWILVVLAMTLGVLLAACGSSSVSATPPTSTNDVTTSTQTTVPPTTTTTVPTGYAGTYTESGQGESISVAYSVGKYSVGNPVPDSTESMLQACRFSTTYIDAGLLIPGTETITYQGSISQVLGIDPVKAGSDDSYEAVYVDGSWVCTDGNTPSANFSPGQTATFKFWILELDAVSNEAPFSLQSQGAIALAANELTGPTISMSGPHAVNCTDADGNLVDQYISAITVPPFSIPHPGTMLSTWTCQAA